MTVRKKKFPFLLRRSMGGPPGLSPFIPITLGAAKTLNVQGLLDTGAAVNVIPFSVGLQLGLDWDALTASMTLVGNLRNVEARGVVIDGVIESFAAIRLAFAWTRSDEHSVILGQVNFFQEFDVCFYRSREFLELGPKKSK